MRQLSRTIDTRYEFMNDMSVSRNGRFLYTTGHDYSIKQWALDSAEVLAACASLSCSHARVRFAQLVRTLEGHNDEVQAMTLSDDDASLWSVSLDGSFRQWVVATREVGSAALARRSRAADSGAQLARHGETHSSRVSAVALSKKGGCLLSGDLDGLVFQWRLDTGEVRAGASRADAALTLTLTLTRAQVVRTIPAHKETVLTIFADAEGATFFTGGNANEVRQWSIQTGEVRSGLLHAAAPQRRSAAQPLSRAARSWCGPSRV